MKDETFVYTCPSCGGKVKFLEDVLKWKCEYCENMYDALFVPKNSVDLSDMSDKKYTYYCFTCDNCHSKFLSSEKENATCNKCNTECSGEGKPTTISKVMDLDITISEANKLYYKEVSYYKKKIDSEYLNQDLNLEYINCDLYNGCIIVTDGNNTKKYIFMNLLIPNIEYDDYRFMYEVGNIGIKNSKAYSKDKNENVENRIKLKLRYFTNVDDINYVDDIINACKSDFIRIYKSNEEIIKIDNNLSVSDGVYLPIYKKTVKTENQYVFGNGSALTPYIIEFPEVSNARSLVKFYKSISNFFALIMFICFPGFWVSFQLNPNLLVLFALLLLVSFLLKLFFDRKYNYYIKTIKISKDDYFEQIINNCNYVKGIKVKK
jgi:hypothetical protein